MINVLQVLGGLDFGGVSNAIMNLYRHIDTSKIHFDFTSTSEGGRWVNEIKERGGDIHLLPSRSEHPFKYCKELQKVIEDGRYDIIHCNSNSASVYLDLLAGKKAGCKIRIAHSHNSNCGVKWQHYLLKPLINSVVTVRFACSDQAASWMFGKTDDYVLINNGIDFAKYKFDSVKREEVRKRMDWDGKVILGNVAAFNSWKNQHYLIALLPKLIEKIPNVHLVFAGDGDTRVDCESLVASLGLENSVTFLGNRLDVPQLLLGFDMFLLPSEFEGLSIAYVEALASGLPVIVSDGVPVASELMCERLRRIRLDGDLWIEAIEHYADDNIERKSLTPKEWANTGFDAQTVAKKLEEIYESLVEGNGK